MSRAAGESPGFQLQAGGGPGDAELLVACVRNSTARAPTFNYMDPLPQLGAIGPPRALWLATMPDTISRPTAHLVRVSCTTLNGGTENFPASFPPSTFYRHSQSLSDTSLHTSLRSHVLVEIAK